MKRAMALLLIIAILFTGCMPMRPQAKTVNDGKVKTALPESAEPTTEPVILKDVEVRYDSLDDDAFLAYVENLIYIDTINSLNSSDYFIEDVSVKFISKEYLEETAYNSQSNIYFGYTLAELNETFKGKKYIFTLGDDGTTVVQELQEIEDAKAETMLKNVAVGTGVILICVTVSVVSAGVGAPAISLIFATSAVSAGTFAVSSAALGGISAGIVRGIQTGDFKEAMVAAAMGATEGFKWGAISGAVAGGLNQTATLYQAAQQTQFEMTAYGKMNAYAKIQQETGYPLDVIKQFHTMEEYQAFRDANLKSTFVNNRSALIKTDIDLTRVDAKGRTNLERMQQGLAPQDSNGVSYELHHVGQKKDGTLAILSQTEHDNPAIHGFLEKTEAHAVGTNWDAERQAFWKAFAKIVG